MAAFRTSRIFDICLILVLAVGLGWAATNRTLLGDKLFFLRYQPDATATSVAASAGLSDEGRRLFYRTDPTFTDEAGVTAACDTERLGCLDARQHSHILDDPKNPTQTVVTAAHEMLHLAYSRLDETKKSELAPLIDAAITKFASDGLSDELNSETSTEDRREEAFCLLGTEYSPIAPRLEEHYKTYFSDRQKVVAAYEQSRR